MEPIKLTNPVTGEVWESGGRGRRPNWVKEIEATGVFIPRKVAVAIQVTNTVPLIPGSLKVWRYTGQLDTDEDQVTAKGARCMIVASDEVNAVFIASKSFKTQMTNRELNLMWRQVDADIVPDLVAKGVNVMAPGVWEVRDSAWVQKIKS